jgi:glycosyltransferase involved in cell wall biosynthesis
MDMRTLTPSEESPTAVASDTGPALPAVTVIVPTRNEEAFLAKCLDSIVATTYPLDRLEVLVADGRSEDRSREIVAEYSARHPWIRLIDNPGRIAPTALNLGIAAARGDVIVRMDSHAVFPRDYLTRLVAALLETGADNVGGCLVTLPMDDTPVARAIALGMSHPFGVGNSYFRIGSRARRWVDTVPFGCFRRDVFDRVGMFDEELVRNQDDEFNFRIVRRGGRVLLDPTIVASYYARRSVAEMSRMFYQYGYFKPLVARKIGRVMTVRQVVPAALLLFVALAVVVALVAPGAMLPFGAVLAQYVAVLLWATVRAAHIYGPRTVVSLLLVFPTIHACYGFGFLHGAWDVLRSRRRNPQSVPRTLSVAADATRN